MMYRLVCLSVITTVGSVGTHKVAVTLTTHRYGRIQYIIYTLFSPSMLYYVAMCLWAKECLGMRGVLMK